MRLCMGCNKPIENRVRRCKECAQRANAENGRKANREPYEPSEDEIYRRAAELRAARPPKPVKDDPVEIPVIPVSAFFYSQG